MNKKFELTNGDDGRPTLWVYEDIGAYFGGITSDDFRRMLGEVDPSSPLDVRVNSAGGIYGEGVAMHNLLASHPGNVTAYVDYLAASAASLLIMGADEIVMLQGSRVMIHEVRSSVFGATADELEQIATESRKTNRDIVSIYKNRWKGSEKDLIAALALESWYDSDEAIAVGFADRKSSKRVTAAHKPDVSRFNYLNQPEEFDMSVELSLNGKYSKFLEVVPEANRKINDEWTL